ncbi:MAG: TIGR00645 family protein [Alphaproteobacteria bacterium]|nr:TIGR00645 family protein [Alphaproteobacteria bacterium]MBL7097955.1 TIGR00645 family protein [Alphaproteobacteria bacterium]
MHSRNSFERSLEWLLFQSRWLMAPVYVGLVLSLLMLLTAFVGEFLHAVPHVPTMKTEEVLLTVLSLIDLSLGLNLVLIVVFSGYENFVSKIDTGDSADRPQWMGTLDFSGMKMKLIGSIVAISAISLLRAFMTITEPDQSIDENHLRWMVILHVTFLASGLLFAAMDYIASLTEKNEHAMRLAEKAEGHR